MKSQSTLPFSVRLNPALKSRLDAEARQQDRPASYVAAKAIEAFLDASEEKRRAIEAALAEANKGEFISSKAMNVWLDTWGETEEIAPPIPDIVADRQ
mgnify:CR=1 FL=1